MHLIDSHDAKITLSSGTNGSNVFLFGGIEALALQVNGTASIVGGSLGIAGTNSYKDSLLERRFLMGPSTA